MFKILNRDTKDNIDARAVQQTEINPKFNENATLII